MPQVGRQTDLSWRAFRDFFISSDFASSPLYSPTRHFKGQTLQTPCIPQWRHNERPGMSPRPFLAARLSLRHPSQAIKAQVNLAAYISSGKKNASSMTKLLCLVRCSLKHAPTFPVKEIGPRHWRRALLACSTAEILCILWST